MACFAVLKAILATSLLPGNRERVAWGVACAAFVAACHSFVIGSSKVGVERALSGVDATMDVSAVVMVDLLLLCAFCRSLSTRNQKGWSWKIARRVPGVLIFPALYYIHSRLFFGLPGVGFATVTGWYAACAGACVACGGWMVARWLPSRESRLELTALLAALVFALAVCCTVFHPAASVRGGGGEATEWRSLGVAAAVTGSVFLAGCAVGLARRYLSRRGSRFKTKY
jgi:hypothetical protein